MSAGKQAESLEQSALRVADEMAAEKLGLVVGSDAWHIECARRLRAEWGKGQEPDGIVIAGTGSLNDFVVIEWVSNYHPKVGDKIYASTIAQAPVAQEAPASPSMWWDAICPKCGWRGTTEHCGGGGAIADTGDHDDPTCPKCFAVIVEDEPLATPDATPETDAWQDADWEACGNDNDYKRMLLAYGHCRTLERQRNVLRGQIAQNGMVMVDKQLLGTIELHLMRLRDSKEGYANTSELITKVRAMLSASPSPTTPDQDAVDARRPKIVCLCGSTRFIRQMACVQWGLERDEGYIVIGMHLLPDDYPGVQPDHMAEHEGFKEHFDELHKRKIDLADEILVFNIGGYIGESTRSEIDYATTHKKPVRYIEPVDAAMLKEPTK